jgi:hypothetical protein
MAKRNPINEMGEAYEKLINHAFELARIDAEIKKPFRNVNPELWPGIDMVFPDYTIRGGQLLGYSDPLHASSKGLSGPGSDWKRIYSHIDREIRAYPYKTILIMSGDGWRDDIIKHAQNSVDYVKLEAVLLGPDKLLCWLFHRAKSMKGLKHKNINQAPQLSFLDMLEELERKKA